MSRYAIIDAGIVTNIIDADAAFAEMIAAQHDLVLDLADANLQPSVGWSYADGLFQPRSDVADVALSLTIQARKAYCESLMDKFKKRNIADGITAAQGLWMHHRMRAMSVTVSGVPFVLDILNMVVSGDVELGCIGLMYSTPDDMSLPYHWLSADRLNFLVSEMKAFLGWP